MKNRRTCYVFSKEFKRFIVQECILGESVEKICRKYHLTESRFRCWMKNESIMEDREKINLLHIHIQQLERENKILRDVILDIAKKG